MKPKRFAPRQHVTQMQRVTALRQLMVWRAKWPPTPADIESLIRSTGLPADVVHAEFEAENMRRQFR